MTNAAETLESPKAAIVEIITRSPGHTCFVSGIGASLAAMGDWRSDLEALLGELESERVLIVRPHSCADPHLQAIDLRIAGLVDHTDGEIEDSLSNAVQRIERQWQEWVTSFLENHRCG